MTRRPQDEFVARRPHQLAPPLIISGCKRRGEGSSPVLVVIIARRVQLHYLGEMMIIIFPLFFSRSSSVDYLRASLAHQSNQERVISEGG